MNLHAKVVEEAERAIDDANDWGFIDFGGFCEAVLKLEDSPEKAHALARLAGLALWYANTLRQEEDAGRDFDE